ncbi:Ger(x)C family spore germination protein [Pseudobacillus badius]|uniref:Ger(x)C family spore germination protein n=1 Tax=Bacillus badius TaxID=1455 RepID=UPI001CC10EC9|nr:Ger(x)C family spore germination protein [Bacillus badius]UAT32930.1 Ger(x)C family spore germination protein [Bacillus badius]GLY12674.1 germination protein [Bacillus badius]
MDHKKLKNQKKRKSFLLVFFLLLPLLSSCWDSNEPERIIYVQGLGVDYKNGAYTVYLQLINPSLIAKSETASKNQQAKVVVGNASGRTLNEAIFNLYRSSQRRIFWGHLSFFVLTEEALQEGALQATLDLLDRYRETRYLTWVYATKEPLKELLSAIPPLEMSTYFSRLSDPEAAYEQSSFIDPVNMREILIALNEPPHEAIIPYVRLAKHTWKTNKKTDQIVQFSGAAFVTKNNLKNTLSYKKIKGLKWLNEDLKREEISIKEESASVSLLIDKLKVKKKVVVTGRDVRFQISVEVDAILWGLMHPKKLKDVQNAAEETMRNEIKQTFLEGIKTNTDVYRLSEEVYRNHLKTWQAVEKNGKVPLTEESLQSISVKIKLIHGGEQRKRPTLHSQQSR